MTLIEILIALFVFMIGALGIFSLVPVGMDQAARTIERRRGGVLAHLALSTLAAEADPSPLFSGYFAGTAEGLENSAVVAPNPEWETNQWADKYAVVPLATGTRQRRRILQNDSDGLLFTSDWDPVPALGARLEIHEHFEGWADASGATALAAAEEPGWTDDQWEGWAVALLSGTGAGQTRLVESNTADALTVSVAWSDPPDDTTRFRISRLALDASVVLGGRNGAVTEVVNATTLETDTELETVDVADEPHRYFLLITSGRAKGRVCRLAAQPVPQTLVGSDVDFVSDGVRPGDTYIVLGNSSGIYAWPGNAFGDTAEEQTAGDPADPLSGYRYVVLFSDPGELEAGPNSPVRADVLVFRFFDNSGAPGLNRKAAVVRTAYIGGP